MLNDYPVVELVVARMESDFSNLTPKLRKPFSGKDIDAKLGRLARCGESGQLRFHKKPAADVMCSKWPFFLKA